MISIFRLDGQVIAQTADLPAVLPIGATISSGFRPADPTSAAGLLRVVAVHYSIRTGELRYKVEPA